ncbi:MAG: hypothetical protein P8129_25330 [Anaerolineae bacterium]|jgi:hypothetical protein
MMQRGAATESRFRTRLLLSGLAGLLLAGLLAGLTVVLLLASVIEPPFSFLPLTLLLVVILGGFSLAEIPIMVFALRRLAVERRSNYGVVLGLNVLYVSFAVVYGLPVLLLTGDLLWGLGLCALSAVRLASSQLFVREAAA